MIIASRSSLQLFAMLALMCLLVACNKKHQSKSKIEKIEVATGACFGPCQLTATSIDSSLNYSYFGGKTLFTEPVADTNNLHGFFKGRISELYWDTLTKKLEQLNYKLLDTVYAHSFDDQTIEFLIYYEGKVKHIRAQSTSLPHKVQETLYGIVNSCRIIKLTPVKKPILFHTIEQQSFQASIDKKDVKFPPPELNRRQ